MRAVMHEQRALLMQTPRLVLHSMSKAFCVAITI
jgi:hypothetical protein